MSTNKRPVGASGVVLALALVAAACGSADNADLDTAAPAESEAVESPADDTTSEAETQDPTDDQVDGQVDGQADEAAADEPVEVEVPESVVEHAFPDLDTVNIVDGSTLNLADELAGGDTPILLWFFAPH